MNISPEKLFLVGIIALVVLGPNRLPQAARTIGKFMAEFRRISGSLQNEVTTALAEPRNALNQAVGDFGLGDVRSQLRNTVNEVVNGTTAAPAAAAPPVDAVNGAVGSPASVEVSAEASARPEPAAAAPQAQPERRTEPLVPDDPSLN